MRTTSLFLCIILASSIARAEYRTYRLGVKYTVDPQEKESEVISTLDEIQYADYFKYTAQQTIRIIEHWMCWGRTDDFKKPCDKPLITKRTPAPLKGTPPQSTGAPPPDAPPVPAAQIRNPASQGQTAPGKISP